MGTNPNAGFRERGERNKRDKCSASRKVKRGGAAIIYCCPSRQAFAFFQRAKFKLENPRVRLRIVVEVWWLNRAMQGTENVGYPI